MQISEADYKLLRELQQNEKQKRNYVKITVLLMLHLGDSAEKIALSLGISGDTVKNYQKRYTELGLDSYLEDHYRAYTGKLSEAEQGILSQELADNFYQNTAQIVAYIQGRFQKCYTCQGLVPLLHRLGFSYKKTKLVPCEANIAKQVAFVKDFEALVSGLGEEEAIYFVDAVHPQHNTRSAYGWIKKGEEKEIPSVSGRHRLNLNGALNALHPEEVIIRQDDTINAQSTQALYAQIEAQNPDKETIYVICDNARYYKNKALQDSLPHSKIKQIFLPPYSPNLNLIERLWKFMRKKAIDTFFYRTFEEFKQKIFEFFQHIDQYKSELEPLISWNFHIPKSKTNFY
jgi:transposase